MVAGRVARGEAEPTKYWLSTLPENISFERLVDLTKLRWRIERDYQELKQEVGLGHYEGRGWRGFTITPRCASQLTVPDSERETISPSEPRSATRSRHLAYRRLSTQRICPRGLKRHVPNSIATVRVRLIHALIKKLPRCPAAEYMRKRKMMTICDAVVLIAYALRHGRLVSSIHAFLADG